MVGKTGSSGGKPPPNISKTFNQAASSKPKTPPPAKPPASTVRTNASPVLKPQSSPQMGMAPRGHIGTKTTTPKAKKTLTQKYNKASGQEKSAAQKSQDAKKVKAQMATLRKQVRGDKKNTHTLKTEFNRKR